MLIVYVWVYHGSPCQSITTLEIPIPLSTTSLFILFKTFIFIACKSRCLPQKQTKLRLSVHVVLFFIGVSVVIDQSVFPENDHFNLELYILTSVCQIFLNKIPLKFPLFAVQNRVSAFRNFSWTSSLHLRVQLDKKSCEKLYFELFAGYYCWTKHIFLNLKEPFCYQFSVLWNTPFTQYLLLIVVEL